MAVTTPEVELGDQSQFGTPTGLPIMSGVIDVSEGRVIVGKEAQEVGRP